MPECSSEASGGLGEPDGGKEKRNGVGGEGEGERGIEKGLWPSGGIGVGGHGLGASHARLGFRLSFGPSLS